MMKHLLKFCMVLLLGFIINTDRSFAQNTPQGDYEGTDFWVAFMPNLSGATLQLSLTSRFATTATISTPLIAGGFTSTVTIAAGAVVVVSVPATVATVTMAYTTPNVAAPTGIHITSAQPVSVYGMNQTTASIESWLSIATPNLGTDYISVALPGGSATSLSQVLIVASDPGTTTITITIPSGKSVFGHAASPFVITLTQGQTYLMQAGGFGADAYELTGIRMVSDKKIGVFGGSASGIYPAAGNRAGAATSGGPLDHFVEMTTPTSAWGGTYVVAPWKFTGSDAVASGNIATKGSYVRVVSGQAGTITVNISGQPAMVLTGIGDYKDRLITSSTVITATQKISAYAIMASCSDYSAVSATGVGDGSFATIAAAEQWGTRYTFATPQAGTAPRTHYVTIIKKSNAGVVTLDGANQTGFANITGTNYYVLNGVSVAAGQHSLAGDSTFIVYTYGIELAGGYSNQVSGSTLKLVVVPVKYLSFSAEKQPGCINLKWSVAEETNAKEFVIERANSSGEFNVAGKVNAHGNAAYQIDYDFSDCSPDEGGTNYYRLKQVDYNGGAYYSKTISIDVPYFKTRIMHYEWTENKLQVTLTASSTERVMLSLYDLQGKLIKQQEYNVQSTGDNLIQFDTGNIDAGTYLLRIDKDGSILNQSKIIKI